MYEIETPGRCVRQLREALGMTQEDLAREVGVEYNAVVRWERDQRYPTRANVWRLMELVERSGDEKSKEAIRRLTIVLRIMPITISAEEEGSIDKYVGAMISRARNSLGISQQELAKKIGTTRSALNEWERGEIKIKVGMLIKIAWALGMPAASLLPPEPEDKKMEQTSV